MWLQTGTEVQFESADPVNRYGYWCQCFLRCRASESSTDIELLCHDLQCGANDPNIFLFCSLFYNLNKNMNI